MSKRDARPSVAKRKLTAKNEYVEIGDLYRPRSGHIVFVQSAAVIHGFELHSAITVYMKAARRLK